jgi:chitodextrinase
LAALADNRRLMSGRSFQRFAHAVLTLSAQLIKVTGDNKKIIYELREDSDNAVFGTQLARSVRRIQLPLTWTELMKSTKALWLFALIFLVSFRPGETFAGPLDTLQPGHWYEVPNSTIRPYLPSPLPLGISGPGSITDAWNGGFFDSARNRYVVMGGGHGDYAGNEMYGFDLNTLQWSRFWGPTPNSQIPPVGSASVEVYGDGNPSSRHTYSGIQYLPNADKYFVHGGSLWSGSGGMGNYTWVFNPSNGIWAQRAGISNCYGGSSVPFTAYDPNTGNIYAHKYVSLCEYNPVTDTWKTRGGDGAGYSPNATAVFDSKRRQFCLIGHGATKCYDMASTASSIPLQTRATTGDKTAENGNYPGVEYDPISDKIVAWVGGADVYTLDLTTKVWTRFPVASSNTLTPTVPTHTGTHGRWRYIPSKNIFIVINGIDQNVYAYKLSSGTGAPAPVLTAPISPSNLQLVGLAAPPPPSPSDSTPPSVPAGLTAQTVSSSQINLSWTASTDNVGVTGYKVFRNGSQITTVATTSYQDTGLLSATPYSFNVAAIDAAGNQSTQTTPVSATTQSGAPPPPPPSGQINIPLRTWVKQGPSFPFQASKHSHIAYNPNDRKFYIFGGDHNGNIPPDPTLLTAAYQSGRNEGYTYDVATNTLTMVQNYCQPGMSGYRMDKVGWTFDTIRNKFWMFPGFQWPNAGECPSTVNAVTGKILTYTPGNGNWQTGPGTWADPNIALSAYGLKGWWTHHDAVTDTFIRIVKSGGCGPAALIYKPTSNTWSTVSSGGVICDNDNWDELATTIDVAGRRIFAVSPGFAGGSPQFAQYNIDAQTWQVRAVPPSGSYSAASLGHIAPWEQPAVWDSINNVLYWVTFDETACPDGSASCQKAVRLHVWNPTSNTWTADIVSGTMSDGTKVKARSAAFDPFNNVLMVYGNVDNLPNPTTFFLFRYGNGS